MDSSLPIAERSFLLHPLTTSPTFFDHQIAQNNYSGQHYIDTGDGEPIVMLHGNPTWCYYYRNLVTAFSQTHRCVAPDHIGCGLSAKPPLSQYDYSLKSRIDNVESLLDHLKIKN